MQRTKRYPMQKHLPIKNTILLKRHAQDNNDPSQEKPQNQDKTMQISHFAISQDKIQNHNVELGHARR